MSYLRATKDGTQYRFSLGSASDTTSGLFPAVKTHNTANGNFSGLLSNVTLYAGRTYYVKVKFRTRGDGNSTSSKCSSVGFIAYWNNWGSARSYIHNSATAYAEIGKIVEWTYSFTVDSDVTPQGTSLYFIINNDWANGNDAQTIDLFYYKYWDSEGNVYNMSAWSKNLLENKKWNDGTSILLEQTKYTYTQSAYSDYSILSESLPRQYFFKNAYVVVECELFCTSEDNITIRLANEGNIFQQIGSVQFYITKGLDYHKYYIAIKITEDVDSDMNDIRLMFSDITNKSGRFGVKSVRMYQHDRYFNKSYTDLVNYLKLTKSTHTYYAKTYDSGRIQMTKDGNNYYLREGADCYSYSELTSYTYGTLTNKFAV